MFAIIGSASIFINDDGMRAIPEEEAQRRLDFYHDNNIGNYCEYYGMGGWLT